VAVHQQASTAFPLITSFPSWQSTLLGRVHFIQRQWTVLQYAVWSGAYQLAEKLLAAGCSPVQPTGNGETALSLAQELKDEKMLSLLQGAELFPPTDSVTTVQINNYVQPATFQARW